MTPIAQGGMAEIWLARQSGPKGFERLVVIKRMIDALESDPEHVDMFLTEARLAAQLNHPHVVQIFDLGEAGQSLYLVMEYLDGENLAVVRRMGIKHQLPLLDHHAVRMVAWAADGLHYAHTRVGVDGRTLGIVHRDISPQNLFATFDGGLKVLDFGVAKLASQHTTSGKLKGKLGYMSPEQARGEQLDARSDVFALGIVLFELVTRGRLFPQMEDTQVLGAIAHGNLPKPRDRRADLDPELEQIVLKAMAPRKEERYQSARELQDALEGWLGRRGLTVTTSDLADYLRALFARRIHDRRQLIEAAMRAEMTPNGVANVRRLAQSAGSGVTSKSRAEPVTGGRRSMVPVFVGGAVGSIVIAVLTFALLAARNPAPPPPVVQPIVAPTPPPPAPPVLVISSSPPGASITVDGKSVGTAPVTLDSLTPGDHLLEATLEGHLPASRTVPLPKPGERLMVEVALAPSPPPVADTSAEKPKTVAVKPKQLGKLTLKTTPWTSVFLGGKKLGDTPLVDVPVPVGTHLLKLTNSEAGLDSSIEVEIKAGQTTVKKLRL
ncbi:MAG: serine/threonine protein kinase [Myxococcaceae bacterium]|nr:serine/threonine protein kinase [Myxococcaceae bacterium]